jgi:hypothetical protein
MRCVAGTEVTRILFQARRADTVPADGDSARGTGVLLVWFVQWQCSSIAGPR